MEYNQKFLSVKSGLSCKQESRLVRLINEPILGDLQVKFGLSNYDNNCCFQATCLESSLGHQKLAVELFAFVSMGSLDHEVHNVRYCHEVL